MGKTIEGAYDAHRRTTKDKVHRRAVRLGSRAFSVLSLRPSTPHRYAMNRFHETWHILCDAGSAHYLGRLLWALSFQKTPNTVLVVDGDNIVPNPFDGEPSRSFAFVNQATTALRRRQSEQLATMMPMHGGRYSTSPDGTVVMQSHSRPKAVAEKADAYHDIDRGSVWQAKGIVFFALSPHGLRSLSLQCDSFDDMRWKTNAIFFGPRAQHNSWYPEGEIQTITGFGPKVNDVQQRRHRTYGDRRDLSYEERIALW